MLVVCVYFQRKTLHVCCVHGAIRFLLAIILEIQRLEPVKGLG